MGTENKSGGPLHTGLSAVPTARTALAAELRKMATAVGAYQQFEMVSPWIKNIWNGAADILERDEPR